MPNTYKLAPMARQLISGEKCNMLFIGDSTASPSNSPRWTQSIIRAWNLDWREHVLYATTSSAPDEGFQTLSDPPTTAAVGETLPDTTLVPPGFSCRYRDYTTNVANFTQIHRLRAAARQSFYRGDPWVHHPLRWRLATLGTSVPLNQFRCQDFHDNNTASPAFTFNNPAIANGLWQAININVPASSTTGTTNRELYIDTAFNVNETGKQYSIGAFSFSVRDKNDGFQLGVFASGGATVSSSLPIDLGGSSTLTPEAIITRFSVMQTWPDLIAIQLGVNMTTEEENNISGVWASRMVALMDFYRDAAIAANEVAPKFMLIVPWATNETGARRAEITAAVTKIANERDDAGVMNLYQQINDELGSWSDWNDTLLADGVHQSTTGVVTIGQISWRMIQAAAQERQRATSIRLPLGASI